jgi:putative tryptophan/tyrosine transport system substrate-binding protein
MRRRDFIAVVGGSVLAWPPATLAQQPASAGRRLGLLFVPSAQAMKASGFLDAFTQALKEAGWIEGQNVVFESRFADGNNGMLQKLAAELAQLRMDAILADGTQASRAAKNATSTIPIVMTAASDAVANGLVASLNRPGGNITGTTILAADLTGRRLQLLAEMVPELKRVAVLTNPSDLNQASQIEQAQTAAQSLSVELHVAEAATPDKLESAFHRRGARPSFDCVAEREFLLSIPPHRCIRCGIAPAGTLRGKAGCSSWRPDGLRPEYSSLFRARGRLRRQNFSWR